MSITGLRINQNLFGYIGAYLRPLLLGILISLSSADLAFADPTSDLLNGNTGKFGIPAISFKEDENGGTYTVTLQILAVMTALTLLPSIVMMMTAFTRIIVVFAILFGGRDPSAWRNRM